MTVTEAAEYRRVIRHFRDRTRAVDWGAWRPLAEGREGKVYVDARRERALKVVVVSLEEDPIEFFEGVQLDALSDAAARRVAPLVAERIQRMIVHPDLHGGNILVSPDRKQVRLIDFGDGAIDTRAPNALLQPWYLRKDAGGRASPR